MMMKKMMMLILLMAVTGMGLQSCSKEESTILTTVDEKTYDTVFPVTKQDLIKYEIIASESSNNILYFLFTDNKAAYVNQQKGIAGKTIYTIFKSWSFSNGKLSMTAEKDGKTETFEYSVSKMYRKASSNEYHVIVFLKDEEATYEFYAVEDGSKHDLAQSWWDNLNNQ
jgi:hypothetical protein